MDITTLDKSKIAVTILDSASKSSMLAEFSGRLDNTLRKKWTARTFRLSNGKIILEFYDKQAILFNNQDEFNKTDRVRFVKNTVYFLKKNISYKIELSFEEGSHILQNEHPDKLKEFKSDMPEDFDFEVYKLNSGQVLFLDKSISRKSATIYPDLKTLSSDNSTIEELVYGSDDDEYLMKKLASGDRLADYETNDYLIYPGYIPDLIKNHKLNLIEKKVYVSEFYGNLYRSGQGYYILIDEVNQKNGAGEKMGILSLRIYETLEDVKNAQARYEAFKDAGPRSEHLFQKISDKYGERFPELVPQLIDSLPVLLNFDKEQLSLDSSGIDLVDEALKWNKTNHNLFDDCFPHVLAYYGECYKADKKDGKWAMYFHKEYKVWIPEVRLKDGSPAWDWIDFCKEFFEGPVPLRWAGDWDGSRKRARLPFMEKKRH